MAASDSACRRRSSTDYLALVGDTSDNVPGVKGIGEKTAQELVNSYGSVENILAHASELTKKRPREALLEQGDMALLSKELVTIRDDLPVTLDLDGDAPVAARLQPASRALRRARVPRAREERRRRRGRGESATDRDAADDAPTPPAPPRETNYTIVDTIAGARAGGRARAPRAGHRDRHRNRRRSDARRTTSIRCGRRSSASRSPSPPGEAYYFPLAHRERVDRDAGRSRCSATSCSPRRRAEEGAGEEGQRADEHRGARAGARRAARSGICRRSTAPEMAPLKALLEDANVKKTAQNAKYDMLALRVAGVTLRGVDFDTMIASYVLDPGRRSHDLDLLALEFLDHKMTSVRGSVRQGQGRSFRSIEVPIECARDYACEDADMTWQLREMFEPQLEALQLADALSRRRDAARRRARRDGVDGHHDRRRRGSRRSRTRFERERKRVEQEIYAAAGEEFNINSNPKLREILFEKLNLPVLKKTATGASTDVSVLQQLADEGHQLPVLLMEYRELAKLESTYIDALPRYVHPTTGRVHTSFSQTVAATGRLSSSEPNLQNIPIRRELGRDIRRGFIPRPGWTLVAADYSQIELRLLAHLSGDPAFVQAFQVGRRHSPPDGGADLRRAARRGDEGDARRARRRSTSRRSTGRARTRCRGSSRSRTPRRRSSSSATSSAFAGVREYLDSMVEFAREHGYVQTIFNRRRYIPELRDRNFNIRAFGERTAAELSDSGVGGRPDQGRDDPHPQRARSRRDLQQHDAAPGAR